MAGKGKSSTVSKSEAYDETIDSIEEEVVYTALSSQIRRDIISFIQANEKVGFLDLKNKFDVKVGSLYSPIKFYEGIMGSR